MIHQDDPKNPSTTAHEYHHPRVSVDPSTQWSEQGNLFDFGAEDEDCGSDFVPFGLRRGLSTGSRLSVSFARPSSAPPIEMQRLSRASSSTALPDDQTVAQDDPRRDPGYATYFHANSRLDPRLPPPIYAPGQSWQQIWNGSIPESISKIRPGPIPEDEDEFGYLQQQIASSSAGSSSSSSLTGSPSAAAHRKRLVDMIQEDFPRTPSPVYARAPALSISLATSTRSVQSVRSNAATAGSSADDFLTYNMQSMAIDTSSAGPSGAHGHMASVQMPRAGSSSGRGGRLAPPPLRFGRHASVPIHPSTQGHSQSQVQIQRNISATGTSSTSALVEEIKTGLAGRNRHIELSELAGHLVRLSVDQHGSRFIQQRLESAIPSDRDRVFSELLPLALDLMTDVFGNYVIQKFFEYGSPVQQETLCGLMKGHVLPLALQMYGCRVVQKALEHGTPLCRASICGELEDSVMRLVKDQNGNHVIQKCIECVPVESAPFLAASFSGQVYALATHPYGCRVIQRFFEHAPLTQTRPLIDELLRFADNLVRDQYGNYVIQHLIERGEPADRDQIISRIVGSLLDLSRHKFASNVVEKAVQFSGPLYRQSFLEELLAPLTVANPESGQPEESFALLLMMRDQFANYVVQKMIDLLDGQQRVLLLERIKPHLTALRKYTYGKHIIAKVDRLLLEQQQQQRK